ncbi:P-selectin glycoprotein ligand 1 [Lepus europaeus]|uniref:P-selectin glycoprotein ligand 1 n=1 Tax=Lepus europaeus TaxID=9983 RepID=UPI002B485758|nr:P-selectin glycoprotein ligand 1 [Lepus europaeus]
MPLHLLLLLSLLGPGGSQQWPSPKRGDSQQDWGQRQKVPEDSEDDYALHDDYALEGTDPPDVLDNSTAAAAPEPQHPTLPGQRGSEGPGTPEPATAEASTGHAAGPDTVGAIAGNLSMELATQNVPVSMGLLATQLASVMVPMTLSTEGVLSTEPVTKEAQSMGPPATEAETTQPAATESETTQPAPTEAETIQPAPTEAETTQPAPTEAKTTQPAPTEAETTQPVATEALSTETTAMGSQPMESSVIEALSTEPAASTESPFIEPTAAQGLATPAPGPSATHLSTPTATGSVPAVINMKTEKVLPSQSPGTPGPVGIPDSIPVKQCLLAILILALVATVFLVCTVVLAVRLSRRNHTYPVRSYSPTEMVCISALLPEAGDGTPAIANGRRASRGPGLKAEAKEERDGDDLTLHSFLP